jgi:hypothetical protein
VFGLARILFSVATNQMLESLTLIHYPIFVVNEKFITKKSPCIPVITEVISLFGKLDKVQTLSSQPSAEEN